MEAYTENGVAAGTADGKRRDYGTADTAAMREAIALSASALQNAAAGEEPPGGPFGAVIYKDGRRIAGGCNHVLAENDPVGARRSLCHPRGMQGFGNVGLVRLRALYELRAVPDVPDDGEMGECCEDLFCRDQRRRRGYRLQGRRALRLAQGRRLRHGDTGMPRRGGCGDESVAGEVCRKREILRALKTGAL